MSQPYHQLLYDESAAGAAHTAGYPAPPGGMGVDLAAAAAAAAMHAVQQQQQVPAQAVGHPAPMYPPPSDAVGMHHPPEDEHATMGEAAEDAGTAGGQQDDGSLDQLRTCQ